MSLDELLQEFRLRGDASAMEELVRRTRPRLLRVARRIGARQDAEDSVQAAYHSLLARGESWNGAPPLAWLITAVVRISYRRKAVALRQHELARSLDRPRESPTPMAMATRDETKRIVRRAVIALPGRYRDVVALHHLEGLSVSEVARLLGVVPSTVTTRLRRARRLLRHKLPPRLVLGVLLIPWLIQDAGAALTPGIGVIMKTQTLSVVVVVGLASGVAGYGAANIAGASAGTTARASLQQRRVRELETQLEQAHDEVRELREIAGVQEAPESAAPTPADVAPTPAKRQRPGRASVWHMAKRMKVSMDALDAAIRAEKAIGSNADDMYELIDAVKDFGEDGFKASLAIVRGSLGVGQPQQKLLTSTFLPGLEGLLLETLDSDEPSTSAKSAVILTLAKVDTPAVRDYLVQRIEHEKDRGIFWALTMTLGELHEPRAAPAVGRKLLFDNPVKEADWKPMRMGMLWHLNQMGGDDARDILAGFLRDERVTDGKEIVHALNSLAQLDKPLCAELAQQILQEPRGLALSEEHDERVRVFLVYLPR